MVDEILTAEQAKKLDAIHNNLPYFASNYLKILNKDGNLVPFQFSEPQFFLHRQLQHMLATKGRVRALLLKGRQMGCSTYVAARFLQHTMYHKGQRSFIMAHDGETTKKLFDIVKLMHDNVPDPIRIATRASNAKELAFEGTYSQYYVGTAGNAEVGRGGTVRRFHGSEVAFWPNASKILAGLGQAVPEGNNTEVILESTANGMQGSKEEVTFYQLCVQALQGKSTFEMVFLPWFWQPEYTEPVPPGFEPTPEEEELVSIYNLTPGQLVFRRNKINGSFGGREWMFKQEYPCNPIEAFQTSGTPLIPVESIFKARKLDVRPNSEAPVIFGVDPGRSRDRTVIARRHDRQLAYKVYYEMNEMRLAGIIANLIRETPNVGKVFIDTGYGWGTIDRLNEMGFSKYVTPVSFGESPISDVYANKRVEMYCNLRDALMQGGYSIPDNDEIHADLIAIPDYVQTSAGKIALIPKEKIRKDFGRSPDIADALALTFAYPVLLSKTKQPDNIDVRVEALRKSNSVLKSRRR